MTEELRKALEALKGHKMSAAELDAQRVSFVYGNSPSKGNDTKESVKRAIDLAQMA
jgi:hypothetical protein